MATGGLTWGSAAAECAESLSTGEFPLRLGDVLKDHPGPATCGQLSPASPGGEQLWLCTCVVRAGALDPGAHGVPVEADPLPLPLPFR